MSMASVVPDYQGSSFLSARRAARSKRTMGIPGPLSTVEFERMSRELAALAKMIFYVGGAYRTRAGTLPWFSETIQLAFANQP